MIQITMMNGVYDEWKPEQYTDYMYDGKCFIIIKEKQWQASIIWMPSGRLLLIKERSNDEKMS